MKLYCFSDGLGYSEEIDCDVKLENDKMVVYFIKSEFSNANKWNEPKVLTDKIIKRYEISGVHKNKDCEKMKKYIYCKFTPNSKIMDKIANMSEKVDEIIISLPTSVYSHTRGLPTSRRSFKDTFLPLLVAINGEDVSRVFQDFDMFSSKAVNVAFDTLINGKRPNVNNDWIEFDKIDALRNKILGSNMADELI